MVGKNTHSGSFSGSLNYLDKAGKDGADRVEWKETRNLYSPDTKGQIQEMMEVSKKADVSKPAYHLMVSWSPNEQPTIDDQRETADRVLKKLGMEKNQAVIVGHNDTDQAHIHIVANKVSGGKGVDLGNDWYKVQDELRAIEKEKGFKRVQGRLTQPEKEIDYSRMKSDGQFHADSKANQGKEPLKSIVNKDKQWKKALRDEVWQAENFTEANERLSGHGMQIRPKKNGAVLKHLHTGKEMKLSDLHRQFSRSKLEERFGEKLTNTKIQTENLTSTPEISTEQIGPKGAKVRAGEFEKATKELSQTIDREKTKISARLGVSVGEGGNIREDWKQFRNLNSLSKQAKNVNKNVSRMVQNEEPLQSYEQTTQDFKNIAQKAYSVFKNLNPKGIAVNMVKKIFGKGKSFESAVKSAGRVIQRGGGMER